MVEGLYTQKDSTVITEMMSISKNGVIFENTIDELYIVWKPKYKSWYEAPEMTKEKYKYLKMIESVYKVMSPSGEWVPINLTNHQAEFHMNDLAIMGSEALNEAIIKSRNTSFTTNVIIRTCNNTYSYRDQVIPAVRINDKKVMELISSPGGFKDIIEHMTPIEIEIENENGKIVKDYWPFNNKLVKFTAHSIEIPDRNVIITGYPANSNASENIRGLRINQGLADEVNFVLSFQNIDAAMIQAARGAALEGENVGKTEFQATYGTTRKGRFTSFNIWFENIERIINTGKNIGWKIYKWPALDPTKVDLSKSLLEQPDLVPIVPWHTLEKLEEKRFTNLNVFKEEYMAMLIDEEDKLYNIQFIRNFLINNNKNDLYNKLEGEWYIGVDPAYSHDLFAISVFNKEFDEEINDYKINQYGVFYKTKVDLTDMQNKCEDLIQFYLPLGLKMMTIDGHGLGVQISNYLKKLYPQHVRVIRNTRIKAGKDVSISAKEFIHTNQMELQNKKKVTYLNDEIQLMHFAGWDNKYEFDDGYSNSFGEEVGHGDTTISNGLALLPLNIHNIRNDDNRLLIGNIINQFKIDEEEQEKTTELEGLSRVMKYEPKELNIDEKLKHYSKLKKTEIFLK
jgi:hypothetical protein